MWVSNAAARVLTEAMTTATVQDRGNSRQGTASTRGSRPAAGSQVQLRRGGKGRDRQPSPWWSRTTLSKGEHQRLRRRTWGASKARAPPPTGKGNGRAELALGEQPPPRWEVAARAIRPSPRNTTLPLTRAEYQRLRRASLLANRARMALCLRNTFDKFVLEEIRLAQLAPADMGTMQPSTGDEQELFVDCMDRFVAELWATL